MDGITIPAAPWLPMDHPQTPVGEPVLLHLPDYEEYLGDDLSVRGYQVGVFGTLDGEAAWFVSDRDYTGTPRGWSVDPDGWLPIPGYVYKPRQAAPFVIGYRAALTPAGWVAT